MSVEPGAEHDARHAVMETECVEWAIQCFTRDGDLHTATAYTTRRQAEDSGDRLAKINGADWWLVSRRVKVTVESEPWTCILPPEVGDPR